MDDIPAHGLIYDNRNLFSWDSPFFDWYFSDKDLFTQVYNDHIVPKIVEIVGSLIGINKWHTNFYFVLLHPSYTALLYWSYSFHCTDCDFVEAHLEACERGEYIDEDN